MVDPIKLSDADNAKRLGIDIEEYAKDKKDPFFRPDISREDYDKVKALAISVVQERRDRAKLQEFPGEVEAVPAVISVFLKHEILAHNLSLKTASAKDALVKKLVAETHDTFHKLDNDPKDGVVTTAEIRGLDDYSLISAALTNDDRRTDDGNMKLTDIDKQIAETAKDLRTQLDNYQNPGAAEVGKIKADLAISAKNKSDGAAR